MKLDIWKRLTGSGDGAIESVGALLAGRELGAPVVAENLQMIPLFGSPIERGIFAPPQEALALERVARYGTLILENRDPRPAIIPLQLGYLQAAAQNHALCGAGILGPKAKQTFTDACCIQQGQGGLMTANDERFIVLPHPLRAEAFSLRGQEGFQKLWKAIAKLNGLLGLKQRGHLDEIKHQHQPDLVRVLHQLEPAEGQTGALFSFNGRFVGLELAPDAAFWAELHTPLVMFCYAPLTLVPSFVSADEGWKTKLDEAGVATLGELRRRLAALGERRKQRASETLMRLATHPLQATPEVRAGAATLHGLSASELAGQAVTHDGKPAYASLFAKTSFAA